MAEESMTVTQSDSTSVQPDVSVAPVESSVNTEQVSQTPVEHSDKADKPEKLFTRDEVAKIANAEKQKAVERARKEFDTAQQLSSLKLGNDIQYNVPPQSTGVPQQNSQLTPEQIQQVQQAIAFESQQKAKELFLQDSANNFMSKVGEAEKKYPDYHTVINKLRLDTMKPNDAKAFIAILDRTVDNSTDVLYHMAKHPAAYAATLSLAYNNNAEFAQDEIRRISNSIKENEAAMKAKSPNPPLSQINASPTGTDNGEMTVSDLRKQSWLRV
jgi:hypothetical protein